MGTSVGVIYELGFDSSGKEKVCQQVYQVEKNQPVTSLHIETFASQDTGMSAGSSSAPSDASLAKIFVMCATPSPTRLYLFLGGPGFAQLFSSTADSSSPSFTELPGSVPHSDLHCFNKPPQSRAQSFALTTKLGIFHGNLLLNSTQSRFDLSFYFSSKKSSKKTFCHALTI